MDKFVASFTDAWIETNAIIALFGDMRSHLLQMRGLKPQEVEYEQVEAQSHLLQMRGLKLPVAHFVTNKMSRIFYRCVD